MNQMIEKMVKAIRGDHGFSDGHARSVAYTALTAIHKHITQSAIEDCIEDNVGVDIIAEEVGGIRDAARAVRKLLTPPRKPVNPIVVSRGRKYYRSASEIRRADANR